MKKIKMAANAAELALDKNTPVGEIRDICAAFIKQSTGHHGMIDDNQIWGLQNAIYMVAHRTMQQPGVDLYHACSAAAQLAIYLADVIQDCTEEPQPHRRTTKRDLMRTLPLASSMVQ